MARSLAGESEFGLGMQPVVKDGTPVRAALVAEAVAKGGLPTVAGDAEAYAAGAVEDVGQALRDIYSATDTFGASDAATAAGTQ